MSHRVLFVLLGTLFGLHAGAQSPAHSGRVPEGALLVKGAWPSASDTTTPVPEAGKVSGAAYINPYFGLRYPLATGWTQTFEAPPPSDSGYYVLAQLAPRNFEQAAVRGTLLIAARDLFFTSVPAGTPLAQIAYTRDHLGPDYKIDLPPAEVQMAGRSFARLGYTSPVAGLHWYVLATQIRCHLVEFIFTASDTHFIDEQVRAMNDMTLASTAGAEIPVCVKGYATDERILDKADAVLSERRHNPIPVRVVIDKQGKVKHVHFLSAFPEQARGITDALLRWRFKPYLLNGRPVEVETGILFGAH